MSGQRIFGADVRLGDTIDVWWAPGRDTIIAIRPYTGVYADTILHGAQLADFAINKSGMTIEATALFSLFARQGEAVLERSTPAQNARAIDG